MRQKERVKQSRSTCKLISYEKTKVVQRTSKDSPQIRHNVF